MIERTEGKDILESVIVGGAIIAIITYILFTMGVITLDSPKEVAVENQSFVNVTEIEQISIIASQTPTPIPEAIPTIEQKYVDPFEPGQRWVGQWYNWYRSDVQGLKDMQIGVVAYRYKFMDKYTWWSPSTGNYFTAIPAPGMRYCVVWVHEEMIGVNITNDPSFWAFDDHAFAIQVKDKIYKSQINETYNPVVTIKELNQYTDYYQTVTAPPFGYYIRYTGHNPETGGFAAEKIGVLRMGKGNAHDGFILYEIPKDSQPKDIMFVGEFGTFGSAQWRFSEL